MDLKITDLGDMVTELTRAFSRSHDHGAPLVCLTKPISNSALLPATSHRGDLHKTFRTANYQSNLHKSMKHNVFALSTPSDRR